MLNLRQFNKSERSQTNSDAQHFSRFSINFRVPSNLLGNIGEPLDYYQSERSHEDGDEPARADAEEIELDTTNLESADLAAGSSGICSDEESDGGVDRQRGPSVASLEEVADVAVTGDIDEDIICDKQVCAASQVTLRIRTEWWCIHRCSKTLL